MYNKCKTCKDVKDCKIRHGFKDLCRVSLPPIQTLRSEPQPEVVPLEQYRGKELTVGGVEPYNEFGQMVERGKGNPGRQESVALRLESVKSKHRLFARSSAKSALLDDSKYVPDEALSSDPVGTEKEIGGWIPEDEPELPHLNPTKYKVLSSRKISPFSCILQKPPSWHK